MKPQKGQSSGPHDGKPCTTNGSCPRCGYRGWCTLCGHNICTGTNVQQQNSDKPKGKPGPKPKGR